MMLNLRQCDGSPTGRRRFTGSVYDSAGFRQGSRPQADTTGRKTDRTAISASTPSVWALLTTTMQRLSTEQEYRRPATTTLTPPEHQALAEIRGAAGAAYFAGRQSLPGVCARTDRRLNRLPGKISY
ncbi:TPA: hypothetical protein KML24_004358 [Escherichia coli]|nr:hypothetical protein [Escherichia coli]HBE6508688.1 hypothetical protein [Escherichia coli]